MIFGVWSLYFLDLEDYGPEIVWGYRYILVVIVTFSYFGLTIPKKIKNDQTKTEAFFRCIAPIGPGKRKLFETDDGKKFLNIIFTTFLIAYKIKKRSGYNSKEQFLQKNLIGAVEIFLKYLLLRSVTLIGFMSFKL